MKKIINIIIICIVAFLGFNMNVLAESNLVCMYKHEPIDSQNTLMYTYTMIIVGDNGNMTVKYMNNCQRNCQDPNNSEWKKSNTEYILDYEGAYNNTVNNTLVSCPEYLSIFSYMTDYKMTFSNSQGYAQNYYSAYLDETPGTSNNDNNDIIIDINPEELQNCESLLGNPNTKGTPAFYVTFIFNIIKYAAILLLIVLSIMDFIGAVASSDDGAVKKAAGKTFKRLILCVILFVLPQLIDFVLELLDKTAVRECINTDTIK